MEAALLTPIFVLLMFGVFEVSFLLKDYLAIDSAASAAARSAATRSEQFAAGGQSALDAATRTASEGSRNLVGLDRGAVTLWVYLTDAQAAPLSADEEFCVLAGRCVRFSIDGTSGAVNPEGGSLQPDAAEFCEEEPLFIGVRIRYEHRSATNFLFGTTIMNADAANAFTPTGAGLCGP